MSLTLNQIIKRIESIALSHQQVRAFEFGNVTEFLTEKTQEYPAVFIQDTNGALSFRSKDDTFNIKMFCLDLVHIAADAKQNELEVYSDMHTLAKGMLALMNSGSYTDWAIAETSNYQLVKESFDDMVSGVVIDLSIRTQWDKSYCEEPIL